jgi:Ran GTPase-activating protein (RanGAP) involved in mRNA processing and transport
LSSEFRIGSLFKRSGSVRSNSNDHYRNPSLEHRIINNEHSWALNLDRQGLIDRDMKIVVKYALMKNRCKRIRLRDNYITSQGISILSEGLSNNTRLESFDLRNNQISDMGVQLLSSAVICSNIKTLNLESNEITAEGAFYLAQMVKESRTLAELYLSKNHLGDRGAELIANALIPDIQQESSDEEVSK